MKSGNLKAKIKNIELFEFTDSESLFKTVEELYKTESSIQSDLYKIKKTYILILHSDIKSIIAGQKSLSLIKYSYITEYAAVICKGNAIKKIGEALIKGS